MNQQTMNNYFECFKGILKKLQEEVNRLKSKEEELKKREEDILTIKENTTQILQLLQRQKGTTTTNIERKIQSLNKTKEIKHNTYVGSITELSNSRMATGDRYGYLTLFAVDDDREQWTKKKEEKGHDNYINSLCELSGNRLVSSSEDTILNVWNISNDTLTHWKDSILMYI